LFLTTLGRAPLAQAGPPPLREAEPLPLVRAAELPRRPVELVPRAVISLSSCASGVEEARCEALGPSLGGELLALYRPTPYFAFGGGLSYGRAAGSLPSAELSAEALSFTLAGRVYLLEEGMLDPYLEALVGWGRERTTFLPNATSAESRRAAAGVKEQDAAFGPFGRAGGGVDCLVGSSVKVGFVAAYGQLVFARGESCRAGRCVAGSAPSGSVRGGITVGVGASVLFGQSL